MCPYCVLLRPPTYTCHCNYCTWSCHASYGWTSTHQPLHGAGYFSQVAALQSCTLSTYPDVMSKVDKWSQEASISTSVCSHLRDETSRKCMISSQLIAISTIPFSTPYHLTITWQSHDSHMITWYALSQWRPWAGAYQMLTTHSPSHSGLYTHTHDCTCSPYHA